MTTLPIVWTIAGSDSGGGAGIQADLKTINALGAHGCSVITAITAQNTKTVSSVSWTSPNDIRHQIQTLQTDLPPKAIKIGMIGHKDTIEAVTREIKHLHCPVILDPVMISTSGHNLLADTEPEPIKVLFGHIDLLTPNLSEAETLVGRTISSAQEIEIAAEELLRSIKPHGSVLIKGGHQDGSFCQDYWTNGTQKAWLTSPKQNLKNTHGTGCTLSSAIATTIAQGYETLDAIVVAKAYVNQGIRHAPNLGAGHGPMFFGPWPNQPEDLPWLTPTAEEGRHRPDFPNCGPTPIGFYPIVPRADWLNTLLPLGVTSIQLRIKDLDGPALEAEIQEATRIAKNHNARLFVNDYWQLALKHGAYGVHLGQSDIEHADLKVLANAGIRLGISTHCYREVSRALAFQPSYMAIGPIFPTTTKDMVFEPQGLQGLQRWRKSLNYPLVAIGGIFLNNASDVLTAGADGVAVVRDIILAENVQHQTQQWLSLFSEPSTQIQTA